MQHRTLACAPAARPITRPARPRAPSTHPSTCPPGRPCAPPGRPCVLGTLPPLSATHRPWRQAARSAARGSRRAPPPAARVAKWRPGVGRPRAGDAQTVARTVGAVREARGPAPCRPKSTPPPDRTAGSGRARSLRLTARAWWAGCCESPPPPLNAPPGLSTSDRRPPHASLNPRRQLWAVLPLAAIGSSLPTPGKTWPDTGRVRSNSVEFRPS